MTKKIMTFMAALAVGAGFGGAKAETVENYSFDFDTPVSTSDHSFKVASGWGHIVDAFTYENPYSGTQTKYQSYSYESTGGVSGGWLRFYGEEIGYTYGGIYHTSTDMIVTPKITGSSSIYLKGSSTYYDPVAKFYIITKEGNKLVAGDEITVDLSQVNSSTWTKVDLPDVDGKYIGIHGSYLGIDNFSVAGSAEIELQKGLSITSVEIEDKAPVCDAENKFGVSLKANLVNNGDVALEANDPDLSVSVKGADGAVLAKQPVGKDIAAGASASVDIKLDGLDYATTGKSFALTVEENITGTSATSPLVTPVGYAPEMALENKYGTLIASGTLQAFGRVNEAKTESYRIENKGTAPLVITEVIVPDGFTATLQPQTVAAKQAVDFDITLGVESFGEHAGDFIVRADGVDDATLPLSGTVLDPEKYFVDFENYEYGGKVPGGITMGDGYFQMASWDSGNGNKFVIRNNSSYNEDQFYTPLLEVAEGESLSFDVSARYQSSSKLAVLYSADRENWTEAKKFEYDEIKTSGYYELRTVKADGIPAGKWFVAFKGADVAIDNIYGCKRIQKAHDMAVEALSVPEKAMVNNAVTVKATLKNFLEKAEAADSYISRLYIAGNDSVSGTTVEIGAEAEADNTFSFTPHHAGTYELEAMFVFGSDTIRSEKAQLTVGEEKSERSAALGTANTTNSYAPLNLGGGYLSESETLYTADKISGLKQGDTVTGITLRGTKGTSDHTTWLRIYIENTDDADVDTKDKKLGGDTTAMLKVYDADYTFRKVGYTTGDVMQVDFKKPFVYTGKNIRLRMFSEAPSKSSTSYTNFEVDNTDQQHCIVRTVSYSYDYDSYDYTEDESVALRPLPVAQLNVYVEPATLSGRVSDGEVAIADAKITLRSGDVEYYGKTDAEGAFCIPVIQTDKTYQPVVEADGYVAPGLADCDMTGGSLTADYNLIRKQVELGADEWHTIILPLVGSYPEGEYWQMKEYDEDNNTLYFNKAEQLSANTPYVFKPAADVALTPDDYAADVEPGMEVVDGFTFIGTYSGKLLASDTEKACMTLAADRTFKAVPEEGGAMFTTAAALYVPAAKAETLQVVFGERIVDGVNGVSDASGAASARQDVYSIDGRLIERNANPAALKKGVYIIGKKKVVVP